MDRRAAPAVSHGDGFIADFRVPEGSAAGTTTLGLSLACINGPEVKIPLR